MQAKLVAALIGAATGRCVRRRSPPSGAPQEAAGAAIALGLVIIPYVFSRCIEKLGAPSGPG